MRAATDFDARHHPCATRCCRRAWRAAIELKRGTTMCHALLPPCVQTLVGSEAPSVCHAMLPACVLPPCVACSHWFQRGTIHVPRDATAVRGVHAAIDLKRGTIHVPRDAAAVCAAYLKRGTIHVPRDAAAVHGVQLLI